MGSGLLTGVDGEAIAGEYRLLGSGDYAQLRAGQRLGSRQCFDYLIDIGSRYRRLYGYGLGYDVCHWIHDLTDSQLDRLAKTGRTYTELGLRFYRVVYRPQVMFRVDRLRGMPTSRRGREVEASATVVDLMRWHREPFADVADDWELGSADERTAVRATKEDRASFSEAIGPLVERYNRAECEMIGELAEKMENGLRQVGLPVSYPLTAGAVAGQLTSRYRVQDYHSEPPAEVHEPIQSAFYGGRMQTCRFGRFEGVKHYDIRSAYGWAMSELPDMLGEWIPSKGVFRGPFWGLRRVRWDIDEGRYPVMPFPHRNAQGYIHYPPRGTGWQWTPLVRAAIAGYPEGSIDVQEGWDYVPLSPRFEPFWWLKELHGVRMALKRAGDPTERLIKLIMVATWGRMCSEGVKHRYGHGWQRDKSPTRGLTDWAGMTTAIIQARILRAALMAPEAFISCCVDGYWTQGEGPTTGEGLGDWSVEQASELFLLRQSCYWKRVGCDSTASTSGLAGGEGVLADVLAEWQERGPWGSVTVPERRCRGLRACHNEGAGYDRLGEFEERDMVVRLNPGFGRYGHICPSNRSGSKKWERWLPYWPPVAHVETVSEPFTPKCDRKLAEEVLAEEQSEVVE